VAAVPEDGEARLHDGPPGGAESRRRKCATTLELVAALDSAMEDVVVAIPLMGPNAARVREIAAAHPEQRISTLVESVDQIEEWRASAVGAFVDLNPGWIRRVWRRTTSMTFAS